MIVINRPHFFTKHLIKKPRYHTQYLPEYNNERTVLIHKDRADRGTRVQLIEFTEAKHLAGQRFAMKREDIIKCPLGGNRKGETNMYVALWSQLDGWQTPDEEWEEIYGLKIETDPKKMPDKIREIFFDKQLKLM